MRDQFLVEAGDGAAIAGLAEMNRLFQAWLETVCHQAVHSETGKEVRAGGKPAGQPMLRHNIKLGVLAALDQRITVRYQTKGMTGDETASYIRHHLETAGRTADLFTDDAITQIHTAARGKPPHREQHLHRRPDSDRRRRQEPPRPGSRQSRHRRDHRDRLTIPATP